MTNSNVEAYYQKNLSTYGAGAEGVGWKNTEAQRVRFDQLLKVIYSGDEFSVNDVGCGVGDLSDYLTQRKYHTHYFGYDILPNMISEARKKYKEQNDRLFFQVKDLTEMRLADYSVASGIFNLKFDVSEEAWKDYILSTIAIMNEKSKLGFSFNALTSYSDKEYMKPELYYSNPSWLFEYCKKSFAKNVALLHDYSQFDFTILVKKNF